MSTSQSTFTVRFSGRVIVTTGDGHELGADDKVDALDSHLDEVMDELEDLEDAVDPAVEAALASGVVHISIAVTAPDPVEAVNKARVVIRTAIHAAGGETPDFAPADTPAWAILLDDVNAARQLQDA